jgi:ATP-dependent DNA ligase
MGRGSRKRCHYRNSVRTRRAFQTFGGLPNALPIAAGYAPMEAKLVASLPEGPQWQYEPKWDGFLCVAFKDRSDVALRSKSGQPFERYFPEIVTAVEELRATRCVLDGELIVAEDGVISFDALLMRIHPEQSRVAKRVDLAYQSGERTGMQKYKRLRTADCVVGGFRGTGTKHVGSLLLGMFDDEGLLHHVGFASNIAADARDAVTRQLEKLVEPPGFTGRAPGGPSRWSTGRSGQWQPLRAALVVEVQYDQWSGERFRHGTRLLRWRPDKAPRQCTLKQVEQESTQALALLTASARKPARARHSKQAMRIGS